MIASGTRLTLLHSRTWQTRWLWVMSAQNSIQMVSQQVVGINPPNRKSHEIDESTNHWEKTQHVTYLRLVPIVPFRCRRSPHDSLSIEKCCIVCMHVDGNNVWSRLLRSRVGILMIDESTDRRQRPKRTSYLNPNDAPITSKRQKTLVCLAEIFTGE